MMHQIKPLRRCWNWQLKEGSQTIQQTLKLSGVDIQFHNVKQDDICSVMNVISRQNSEASGYKERIVQGTARWAVDNRFSETEVKVKSQSQALWNGFLDEIAAMVGFGKGNLRCARTASLNVGALS